MADSTRVDAALALAARGWSVIPFEPRGKRPLVAWRSFQQQPADAARIRRWWCEHPDANVGIVTGRVSGVVVVDVDPAHGGAASLAALEAAHGPLAPTVEAQSGGGGRHLYFAHPGGPVPNRVGLVPGIDLRGDGGCVVAPPSVHPSGRRYAWVAGHAPDERRLAPLPDAFTRPAARRPAGHARLHWRRLVREGIAEGARNNTLASLAGHLLRREVDPDVVQELLLAWNRGHCRPPLRDAEVAAVVQSIARLQAREAGDGA